ncbi:MAG: hypothetical protein JKY50_00640 [Oleispira sp.]|nr:hypothetical protein [Oleispira sp.]
MNNSDMPAMPLTGDAYIDINGSAFARGSVEPGMGLTKREHFAGLAMQGLVSNHNYVMGNEDSLSDLALTIADALLAELEKGNG